MEVVARVTKSIPPATGSLQPAASEEEAAGAATIGAMIRKSRRDGGLSLQRLAGLSGVSIGMLSQVERGLVNPSLRVLTRIRDALGLPASAFFQETKVAGRDDPVFVRRAKQRTPLDLGYLTKELLSADASYGLQLMILDVPAGSSTGDRPLLFPAEKAGLVMDGEILLQVGDARTPLAAGDSFSFDGSIPHSFSNPAAVPARLFWVIGSIAVDRHV